MLLDTGLGDIAMKVKLCPNCAYTPQDLEGCYDPDAETFCCTGCPALEPIKTTAYYPKDNYEKRKYMRLAQLRIGVEKGS